MVKTKVTEVKALQSGLVLLVEQNGVYKSMPLVDLLPPEAIRAKGMYKITVEFSEIGINTEERQKS